MVHTPVLFNEFDDALQARRSQDIVRISCVNRFVDRFDEDLEAIRLSQAKKKRQKDRGDAMRIFVVCASLRSQDARLPQVFQLHGDFVDRRRRTVERASIRPHEPHVAQEDGIFKVVGVNKLHHATKVHWHGDQLRVPRDNHLISEDVAIKRCPNPMEEILASSRGKNRRIWCLMLAWAQGLRVQRVNDILDRGQRGHGRHEKTKRV